MIGVDTARLEGLRRRTLSSAVAFRNEVRELVSLPEDEENLVVRSAEIFRTHVTPEKLAELDREYLGPERSAAVETLSGHSFDHKWQLQEALETADAAWQARESSPANKDYNKQLEEMLDYVFRHLAASG